MQIRRISKYTMQIRRISKYEDAGSRRSI